MNDIWDAAKVAFEREGAALGGRGGGSWHISSSTFPLNKRDGSEAPFGLLNMPQEIYRTPCVCLSNFSESRNIPIRVPTFSVVFALHSSALSACMYT